MNFEKDESGMFSVCMFTQFPLTEDVASPPSPQILNFPEESFPIV